jgi:hypothetical protein
VEAIHPEWHVSTGNGTIISGKIPESVHPQPADFYRIWCAGQHNRAALNEADRAAYDELSAADANPPGVRLTDRLFRQARHGFGEAFLALQLREEGFDCWTGTLLFRGDCQMNNERDKQVTDHVECLLRQDRFCLPSDLDERRLGFLPKNPDLVVRHRSTGAWGFFEVKRGDTVLPGQLEALMFLHLLTGGSAAIVRVVPDSRRPRPKFHRVRFGYLGRLDEVAAPSFRERLERA